jgi:hypothetical protein
MCRPPLLMGLTRNSRHARSTDGSPEWPGERRGCEHHLWRSTPEHREQHRKNDEALHCERNHRCSSQIGCQNTPSQTAAPSGPASDPDVSINQAFGSSPRTRSPVRAARPKGPHTEHSSGIEVASRIPMNSHIRSRTPSQFSTSVPTVIPPHSPARAQATAQSSSVSNAPVSPVHSSPSALQQTPSKT